MHAQDTVTVANKSEAKHLIPPTVSVVSIAMSRKPLASKTGLKSVMSIMRIMLLSKHMLSARDTRREIARVVSNSEGCVMGGRDREIQRDTGIHRQVDRKQRTQEFEFSVHRINRVNKRYGRWRHT